MKIVLGLQAVNPLNYLAAFFNFPYLNNVVPKPESHFFAQARCMNCEFVVVACNQYLMNVSALV